MDKYKRLLSYSQSDKSNYHYKSMVYIHDDSKTVIATDGFRLLADRQLYNETKVLARILGSNCLEFKDGVFVSRSDHTIPRFNSIVPDQKRLDSNEYRRISLTMPNWIKGISKREKKPYVSFVLGDSPMLTVGSHSEGQVFNAHFLKDFAGLNVVIYLKHNDFKAPMVVMPHSVSDGDWFSMVCPLIAPHYGDAKYL